MHGEGIFKRVLEANEQPQQITNICAIVDEATKNFQVSMMRHKYGADILIHTYIARADVDEHQTDR